MFIEVLDTYSLHFIPSCTWFNLVKDKLDFPFCGLLWLFSLSCPWIPLEDKWNLKTSLVSSSLEKGNSWAPCCCEPCSFKREKFQKRNFKKSSVWKKGCVSASLVRGCKAQFSPQDWLAWKLLLSFWTVLFYVPSCVLFWCSPPNRCVWYFKLPCIC